MKKRNLFLTITAMAVVTIISVAVVSCKKDTKTQQSEQLASKMPKLGNMDEYLLSFKKELLSAQKGEETISLEQAERDLGNLLNFDFGDANYATDTYQYDTIHVKLSLDNGQVDMSQLAITYRDAVNKVIEAFDRIDLLEKSIYTISCSFNQEAKDVDSDGTIIITTRGLSTPQPQVKISFDQTDNWHVANGLGKCDGTCVGDDHLTMLKLVYDNTRSSLSCDGRVYFTDESSSSFIAHSFPDFNPSGPGYNEGYRLWHGHPASVDAYCVSYLEMEYYLENLKDILDNWMFLDADQYVTGIELSLVDYVGPNPSGLRKNVKCDFDYATVNCTIEPIEY